MPPTMREGKVSSNEESEAQIVEQRDQENIYSVQLFEPQRQRKTRGMRMASYRQDRAVMSLQPARPRQFISLSILAILRAQGENPCYG